MGILKATASMISTVSIAGSAEELLEKFTLDIVMAISLHFLSVIAANTNKTPILILRGVQV